VRKVDSTVLSTDIQDETWDVNGNGTPSNRMEPMRTFRWYAEQRNSIYSESVKEGPVNPTLTRKWTLTDEKGRVRRCLYHWTDILHVEWRSWPDKGMILP